MRKKTLYTIAFIFCMSAFSFSKGNIKATGEKACKGQSKETIAEEKPAIDKEISDLPHIIHLFLLEI